MKEKLIEILDSYSKKLERMESKVESLNSRIEFCTAHKFEWEAKIAHLELCAIETTVYRWREMVNEITDLVNKY